VAEFARGQIHAYGPDWRLPHSMASMSAQEACRREKLLPWKLSASEVIQA
jgi:hypothetical protein